MMNKVFSFFLILLMSAAVGAQNYPSFPVGEYWQFPDARSLSMGGAGSVSLHTPGAILYNPAALTGIRQQLSAQVSLSGRKMEERRGYPLYDRFDGIIGNGIYAINNNFYFKPQGAIAFRLPVSTLPGLTLAAGSFTELDQDYLYNEEVRKNIFGDSLMAYNRIEYSGGLQRYSIAAATGFSFLPGLSVGLQAGFLSGSLDYERSIIFVKHPQQDQRVLINRTLDNTPVLFSIGATYKLNPRISGGLHVDLPYTVKYTASDDAGQQIGEEIGYPLRLTTSWEYRARQLLQARLNVDFSYEFWSNSLNYASKLSDVFNSPREYNDVYVIKVGLEQIFFNKIPFRVGMQYRNSYREKGTTRTLFSAGTGFLGDNWKVDLAGGVSKLEYRWPDLFDDTLFGGDRSNSSVDTVDEYYFFGQISLVYFLNFR